MNIPRSKSCQQQIGLINELRMLWEQHVMWTRSFIISTVSGLGDLDAVTARLLRNPDDFTRLLRKFYGQKTTDAFRELFTQHLLIAADLVKAAKAGNSSAAMTARQRWYANAEDMAKFLSNINPSWSESRWKRMLFDHLRMTEDEAVLRLNRRYAEDIENYDRIEGQALEMADYMAQGIINQHFNY
jgi:hypothetical protein